MVKLIAETVKFKRPNATIFSEAEEGLMIGTDDRHIIIDSDLNIVINGSIEGYNNNQSEFLLLENKLNF